MLLATERSRALAPAGRRRRRRGARRACRGRARAWPPTCSRRPGSAPVVGLGGGRVVDTAKAVARCDGHRGGRDPHHAGGLDLHALPPAPRGSRAPDAPALAGDLRARGHGAGRRAAAGRHRDERARARDRVALRAARQPGRPRRPPCAPPALFADALPRDPAPAPALAEAAFLAGYAVGNAGLAVHHAVCQTIVRTCGTPHAQTNAVMLPHSVRLMSLRAPR